jgi:hypothetical protein
MKKDIYDNGLRSPKVAPGFAHVVVQPILTCLLMSLVMSLAKNIWWWPCRMSMLLDILKEHVLYTSRPQSILCLQNIWWVIIKLYKTSTRLVVMVVVTKKLVICSMIYVLLNVVGRSSKQSDMIRDINLEVVHKTWGCAMLGRLLNQEQCLQRPKDISWDSHSKTLKSLGLKTFLGILILKHSKAWLSSNQ